MPSRTHARTLTEPVDDDTLVRVRDGAEGFDVSEQTLYRRIRDGSLPATRIGERGGIRVRVGDLRALLQPVVAAPTDAQERRLAWVARELAKMPDLTDESAERLVKILRAARNAPTP